MKIKGNIFIKFQNQIFSVYEVNMTVKIGQELTPITFKVENVETKKKPELKLTVDSNLAHDLLKFGKLNTQDFFVIDLEERTEAVWNTIPEEEWKKFIAEWRQKTRG